MIAANQKEALNLNNKCDYITPYTLGLVLKSQSDKQEKSGYRVGDILITTNTEDPAIKFGGTWERIKDKFLLACGETYSNGDTGGSLTTGSHKLTEKQLPVITAQPKANVVCHQQYSVYGKGLSYIYGGKANSLSAGNYVAYGQFKLSFGGGEGHTHTQNLPPYLAVYMWVKTA